MWQRLLFETVQEIYVAKTSVGDCLGDIYMWQRLQMEISQTVWEIYMAKTSVRDTVQEVQLCGKDFCWSFLRLT